MQPIRSILTRCALAATVVLLAGCGTSANSSPAADAGGDPVSGGSLTVVIPDSIDGWNPDAATQVATYQLLRAVVAPLLEVSDDGREVIGGLATEWAYDDTGTELTLTLSPEATFSTGDPVTPADVVFSVEQWLAGPTYGPLYANFIASAEAAGPDTVTLTLTAPSSAVVPMLTWSNSAIVPADFGGVSAAEFYRRPVGAGPFSIADQRANEEIRLVRNEHYHQDGRPYLDEVVYRVVDDNSQRLLQVQSGDADLADRVPIDALTTADPAAEVVSTGSSTMSVITFSQAGGPTKDAHFRKAVSLAIDRQALVDSVYEGMAAVAEGTLPSVIPGADGCPSCTWAAYDPSAAADEVDQISSALRAVELIVDSSRATDLLAAQAIQPMLAEVGIDVQITQVDSATFLGRLAGSDFEMAIGNYSAYAPTAVDPLSFFAATSYLFTGADPMVPMGALAAVSAAADVVDQAKAVADFEQQNYATATVVPLVSPDVASVAAAGTHGLTLLPSGLYDPSRLWRSE